MNLSQIVETFKEEIISNTQQLIRIESTEQEPYEDMPFGQGVQASLEFTLNLCESLGFKTKNVDNQVGYAEIGDGDELIGILAHLDVVPAGDPSTWNYPPYDAVIEDGKIFGRGTIDDKGPAMAGIYAMKAILDSGISLNKRIRIIFGLNEETHWKSINYYLEHEEIPSLAFTPDADFPVIHGEKGILVFNMNASFEEVLADGGIEVLSIKGGNRPNMVPDYAEATVIENKPFKHILETYSEEKNITIDYVNENDQVTIKVHGVSSHGAKPETGVNAIAHLLNLLNLLDLQIGDLTNFIRFYAKHIGTEVNGENIGCHLSDELSGLLTFNVGTIDCDQNHISIGINVRYPITHTSEEVYQGIQEVLDKTVYNHKGYITLEKKDHMQPIYFEKDHHLIKALMTVYKKHTGDSSEPITIGGGTYARSMPNAVAFGPLLKHREETAHQANEHIYIEDLMLATKIYADALEALL
jgi:succinyl-diaminopimelate desuccinylase